MALSEELIRRFKAVDPATMGHYIGGGYMRPEMKPLNIGERRMVGPAIHNTKGRAEVAALIDRALAADAARHGNAAPEEGGEA